MANDPNATRSVSRGVGTQRSGLPRSDERANAIRGVADCRKCGGTGFRIADSVKEAVDRRVPYYGPGAVCIPCECRA